MNNILVNELTSAFNEPVNKTLTENGAIARATTNSKVLDLFSQIGGFRVGGASEDKIIKQVRAAFAEDRELTLRTLFYSRDIRGGQGERQVFRTAIKALAQFSPDTINKVIPLIPEYGRWDDLYELLGTECEQTVWDTIRAQWWGDLISEYPSIMAKWLAGVNTSSALTRERGRATARALGFSERNYRKLLSELRARIGIIEQKMSSGNWGDIEYSHVPSQANMLYKDAFYKHDPVRRQAYLDSLVKGEVKVNAVTQFPYELIAKLRNSGDNTLIEAMWEAQPDYFNGKKENSLVVADVSSSMYGLPLEVCISLAIYTAERNTGPWHNKFITFSESPTMQTLIGKTLLEKVSNLNNARWDLNTNVEKVFTTILETAILNNVSPSEMVARVYIVSDMEFDAASGRNKKDRTLFNWLQKKYKDAGYNMPELVFWNVSARNTQFPMSMDDRGFLNVSGCSPSIFKSVVGKNFISAYDLMLEVINSDRYKDIKV
jgi:hypothetical protein